METCFHVDVVFSTKPTKYSAFYGKVGVCSHLAVDVSVSTTSVANQVSVQKHLAVYVSGQFARFIKNSFSALSQKIG